MVAREETPSLRIYRLVLSGSAMRAARIVSQLAILATAARLLSTAEVGVYAYVMVAVSVLAIPAQLGLPPIVIRETARALAEDRTDDARAIIVWANRVVLLAGTVAIALLAMFLMLGPGPQIGAEATACAAFLLLAGTCLHVNGAVLRGMGRILPGQVGIFIVAPLVTLSLLVGLWATGIDLDVGDVLLCHCAGMAAALVTVSGALAFGMGGPRTKAAPVELRSRLRSMTLVALVGSVYILNTSLDTIMLGILTDEEGVALYRVAAVAAGCIAVIAQAFNAMIGPIIARGGSRPDIEMIERVLRTSAPLVQGAALAVVAALALGGMTLLPLVFGAPYAAAYAAMAILLVAQYANIVFGPVGVLLNMTGNEHVALRTAIIAVIMNLCLNLLLIPPLGAEGAALATATTVACWNFGLWRSARAATGVDTLCWLKFASKT